MLEKRLKTYTLPAHLRNARLYDTVEVIGKMKKNRKDQK